jgi:hypothetical protein
MSVIIQGCEFTIQSEYGSTGKKLDGRKKGSRTVEGVH